MRKSLKIRQSPGNLAGTSVVNQILSYHYAAATAARQSAAFGALCGLALKALKREVGHGEWESFREAAFGEALPDRTARYYMQVASGLRVKAKDLPELTALLEIPAGLMEPARRDRLGELVREITDGETMASLIEAYRITRPRREPAEKGGYRVDEEQVQAFLRGYHPELVGSPYAELSPEIQEHFRRWVVAGERDGEQAALDFFSPVFNAFEHREFEARIGRLPVPEKQRLRDHLAAVVDRLNQELGR